MIEHFKVACLQDHGYATTPQDHIYRIVNNGNGYSTEIAFDIDSDENIAQVKTDKDMSMVAQDPFHAIAIVHHARMKAYDGADTDCDTGAFSQSGDPEGYVHVSL